MHGDPAGRLLRVPEPVHVLDARHCAREQFHSDVHLLELVGVSSYLLIGFWFEKASARTRRKKAFLTNRLGDFGFMLEFSFCGI